MKDHKVGGRPLIFETPQALIDAINAYLKATAQDEYSVTGLALAIGTSREVLDDYMMRDDYKEIVKEAKLIVENSYELSLRRNGRSGDIFALKNFGWRDRTEMELSGGLASTEIKLKEFMDNTDDGAYPDTSTADAQRIESTTQAQPEGGDEVAPGPTDIS